MSFQKSKFYCPVDEHDRISKYLAEKRLCSALLPLMQTWKVYFHPFPAINKKEPGPCQRIAGLYANSRIPAIDEKMATKFIPNIFQKIRRDLNYVDLPNN